MTNLRNIVQDLLWDTHWRHMEEIGRFTPCVFHILVGAAG